MLVLSIIFITYYFARLIKGNLFHNQIIKGSDISLKQAMTTDKTEKTKLGKELISSSYCMFLALPLAITEYIFLIKAIPLDSLKYPTIIMIFYSLLNIVFSKGFGKPKNMDLTTEEGIFNYKVTASKIKRYSVKGFITALGCLVYYGYMFYGFIK